MCACMSRCEQVPKEAKSVLDLLDLRLPDVGAGNYTRVFW